MLLIQLILLNAIFLASAILSGTLKGDIKIELGHLGLITWISVFQLLIIAAISLKIFKLNHAAFGFRNVKSTHILWVIIAIGFLLLALSEAVQIHSMIGQLICNSFNIKNPSFTSRIDDLIVVSYALVGIALLYFYRNTLKKHTDVISLFFAGFSMLLIMVLIDILPYRVVHYLKHIFNTPAIEINQIWLPLAKDAAKLFAEGIFIAGFYHCFKNTKEFTAK
jgi:hypothetical protein